MNEQHDHGGQNGGQEDGGVLPFPRAVLPPPTPNTAGQEGPHEPAPAPAADPEDAPAAATPRVPEPGEMVPPLDLMPSFALPELEDAEEGAFTGPHPQDPDQPGLQDMVGTGMALMTAVGVAAAQGMWHRARHRRAVADAARERADKQTGRSGQVGQGGKAAKPTTTGSTGAAKTGRSGGGAGTGAGVTGGARRKAAGPAGGASGASGKTGSPQTGAAKRAGSTGAGAAGAGPGRTRVWADRAKGAAKAAKGGTSGKSGAGTAAKGTAGAKGSAGAKGATGAKGPDGKAAGKDAAKKPGAKTGAEDAAKKTKAKTGEDTGKETGPKKAGAETGAQDTTKKTKAKKTAEETGPKKTTSAKTGSAGDAADRARSSRPSWRSWRFRGTQTEPTGPTRPTEPRRRAPGPAGGEQPPRMPSPPPMPPPSAWESMRPPPQATQTAQAWAEPVPAQERTDQGRREQGQGESPELLPPRPVPPVDAAGRVAEPVGTPVPRAEAPRTRSSVPDETEIRPVAGAGEPTRGQTVAPSSTPAPVPAVTPAASTQYGGDSELTVYDVIEADADMAEQITAGVERARSAADDCDRLFTQLESLHAHITELQVPGVLESLVVQLMDKTGEVKAKAVAIAEQLPAAAEAIAVAGTNAEARHKPLADAVADAGHARPAEREYHAE